MHFIAEAKCRHLLESVAKANSFSVLLDGSTDTANIDNEILLLVWCDPDGSDEKVHTGMDFLTPQSATCCGLFQVLEVSLQRLGTQELSIEGGCTRLVGVGLKGLAENRLDWVFWMWCMAHRLELAIKDALKGTFFDDIDEKL